MTATVELPRRTKRRTGCPVLVWQADTATTHPDLDPGIIAAAHADDPVAAAAEYAGQFRSDPEGYLAREALDAAIVSRRYELPPLPDVPYVAFTDPSRGAPMASHPPSPTRTRPRAVCSSI